MAQLTPIQFEDGTTIYVEATEAVDALTVHTPEESGRISKGGGTPQQAVIHNFHAIEGTIRAYTHYTLNAFKQVAIANINEVTLEFGIKIGGEMGIPYITKGTAESNLKITVKCSFAKMSQDADK
jgi:hypothetical protein